MTTKDYPSKTIAVLYTSRSRKRINLTMILPIALFIASNRVLGKVNPKRARVLIEEYPQSRINCCRKKPAIKEIQ